MTASVEDRRLIVRTLNMLLNDGDLLSLEDRDGLRKMYDRLIAEGPGNEKCLHCQISALAAGHQSGLNEKVASVCQVLGEMLAGYPNEQLTQVQMVAAEGVAVALDAALTNEGRNHDTSPPDDDDDETAPPSHRRH